MTYNACTVKQNNYFNSITFYNRTLHTETKQRVPRTIIEIEETRYSINLQTGEARNISLESKRRAKARILELALNNEFNAFVTFTFDDKKQGVDTPEEQSEAKNRLLKAIDNYKQRIDADFLYLIVPELGGEKKRLHFHALCKISPNQCTYLYFDKKKNKKVYRCDYFYEHFGACQVIFLHQDSEAVAFYIAKYISKDESIQIDSHRYFASKRLKTSTLLYGARYNRVVTEKLQEICQNTVPEDQFYTNDYTIKVKVSDEQIDLIYDAFMQFLLGYVDRFSLENPLVHDRQVLPFLISEGVWGERVSRAQDGNAVGGEFPPKYLNEGAQHGTVR